MMRRRILEHLKKGIEILREKKMMVVVFLFLVVVFGINEAQAQGSSLFSTDDALNLVGTLFYYVLLVPLGKVFGVLVYLVVWVAGYNNFIYAKAVETGWKIVRDFSNIFFVLLVLIIAYATILRIESYQIKRLLPKLLIMAVLINFSKMLVGLLIDLAQVITINFVNQFQDFGPANILGAMGVGGLTKFDENSELKAHLGEVVVAIVVGSIMLFAAVIVILAIIIILCIRIVMLWLLIVLSPIAFIASLVPLGQKYASQWWTAFGKYVLVGPILAFFLWLSLSIMSMQPGKSTSMLAYDIESHSEELGKKAPEWLQGDLAQTAITAGITQALSAGNILSFIIAILLLVAGLMLTQQMGVIGGDMVAKYGMGAIKGFSKGIGKGLSAPIRKPLSWGAHYAERGAEGLSLQLSRLPIVGAPFIPAYTKLKNLQDKREKDAETYTANIDDRRVLKRIASKKALTSRDKALKKAALKKDPTLSGDTETDLADRLNSMKPEDVLKISANRWYDMVQPKSAGGFGLDMKDLDSLITTPLGRSKLKGGAAGIEYNDKTKTLTTGLTQVKPSKYDKNKYYADVTEKPGSSEAYARVRGAIEEREGVGNLDALSREKAKEKILGFYASQKQKGGEMGMSQEDFSEYYNARRMEKPLSREGVTMGRLALTSERGGPGGGEVKAAVNFGELNKYIGKEAKKQGMKPEDVQNRLLNAKAKDVTVSAANAGLYAPAMSNYIGENIKKIEKAKSARDKVEALKQFGVVADKKKGDETEEQYNQRLVSMMAKDDTLAARTLSNARQAQQNLSDPEYLKNNRIILANKGEEAGPSAIGRKAELRHEEAHPEIDEFVGAGGKLEDIFDILKSSGTGLFEELEQNLKSRLGGEYDPSDVQGNHEEMMANFMAGNYKVDVGKQDVFTDATLGNLKQQKDMLAKDITQGEEEAKGMGLADRGKKNKELEGKRAQLGEVDRKIGRQEKFMRYGASIKEKEEFSAKNKKTFGDINVGESGDVQRAIEQRNKARMQNDNLYQNGQMSKQTRDSANSGIDKEIETLRQMQQNDKEVKEMRGQQDFLVKRELSENIQVEMKESKGRAASEKRGAETITPEVYQAVTQNIALNAGLGEMRGGAAAFGRAKGSQFFDPYSNFFVLKVLKKLQEELRNLAKQNIGVRTMMNKLANEFSDYESKLSGLDGRIQSGSVAPDDYAIADEVAGKLNALLPHDEGGGPEGV